MEIQMKHSIVYSWRYNNVISIGIFNIFLKPINLIKIGKFLKALFSLALSRIAFLFKFYKKTQTKIVRRKGV